ncbi:LysE family translocator [Simiduia curdlanivorans]|uniref:LysE family translocator n=1 Tax=Simiduia curdlanivorans TaxID=1492769 RepID=A0ABV8V603_9GAMM|nr:LysE family translocator [Simiduia curdlanivorans]MDN3640523.1 LysE family translocator [Simiduia curdlanivorans]
MLLSSWLSVAGICALGAMSPGPSLAVVMNNTVNHGRKAGILTAVGHGLGVTAYAAATALGLAVVIAQSALIFDVIRYLGAAFLLFIAYKTWVSTQQVKQQSEPSADQDKAIKTPGFISGLMIAALNPKMAIFFLALFSQFVQLDAGLGDKLILALTAGTIDTLWYLLVAWGLATPKVLNWLSLHQKKINQLFALVIALLAATIVFK